MCLEAEKYPRKRSRHRLHERFERTDETIAMAAMYAANHLEVRAILHCEVKGDPAAVWKLVHRTLDRCLQLSVDGSRESPVVDGYRLIPRSVAPKGRVARPMRNCRS